ncbi:hypothetical protein [Peterkaempfera sp. SMS 1(5)a]|uniref:hypothetical protein n=1 Tax=Peterkaempfera podocarpi TaxID=3232308 RepID=UPI00366BED1D
MAAWPAGDTVHRVVWIPGTDRLHGWCWYGTEQESDDPVELWEWPLAHPDAHSDPPTAPPPPCSCPLASAPNIV